MQRQSGRGAKLVTVPGTVPEGECYACNVPTACFVTGVFADGKTATAYPLQAGHNPMGFKSVASCVDAGDASVDFWAVYL